MSSFGMRDDEPVERQDLLQSYATAELTIVWLLLIICFGASYVVGRARLTFLPPAVLTILIGMASGLLLRPLLRHEKHDSLQFDPMAFWFAILPPILFAAGFNLKRKDFIRNFLPCFLYAVVGTAVTAIAFGLATYSLLRAGFIKRESIGHNALVECLMYGSLIAATDPVATLSVLANVSVPKTMYSFIFGESVLNDPISLQLFNTFKKYAHAEDQAPLATLWGIITDFTFIAVMSIIIGVGCALVGSAVLKQAQFGASSQGGHSDGSLFEIFLVVATSYLGYLIADWLDLSGIFAIFFAAVVHSHYSFHNISAPSQLALKKIVDLAASVAETLMFLILGLQVFTKAHSYDMGLILSGIPLCLLGRALNVFPLSWVVNTFRARPIPFRVQLFHWYCGLRGAVCFALALNCPMYKREESGRRKVLHNTNPYIETATLFIVIITTLTFGTTTGLLLRILDLEGKTDYDLGLASPLLALVNRSGRRGSVGSRAGSLFQSFDEEDLSGIEEEVERLALNGVDGHGNGNGSGGGGPSTSRRDVERGAGVGLRPVGDRAGLHFFWRTFDERYLKPIFGGRADPGRTAVRFSLDEGRGTHAHRQAEMSPLLTPSRGSPEPDEPPPPPPEFQPFRAPGAAPATDPVPHFVAKKRQR